MSQQQAGVVKVGIMGSAGIAKKGWGAMHAAGLEVGAVASRSVEKAQAFIDHCQSLQAFPTKPTAVKGYEALLEKEDIQAVYIPLPTMLHKEWVIKALQAGKHVVMEKPVTVALEDLQAMQALAAEKKLVLLDGTMLTHGKRCDHIRATVASGAIGAVSSLAASFTFPGDSNFLQNDIRVNPEMDPLGAAGDVGWYCIRYALELFPHWTPVAVSRCEALHSINGINVAFDGVVSFDTSTKSEYPASSSSSAGNDEGVVKVVDHSKNIVNLTFHTSFMEADTQAFRIVGTTGTIELDDFCLPVQNRDLAAYDMVTASIASLGEKGLNIVHTVQRQAVQVPEEPFNLQETQLWRNVGSLVQSGISAVGGKTPAHYQEITWKTQAAVTAAIESSKEGGKVVPVVAFSSPAAKK